MASALGSMAEGEMSNRKQKRLVNEIFGGTNGASMRRKALKQADGMSMPDELLHVARKLDFDEFKTAPLEEISPDAPLAGIPFLTQIMSLKIEQVAIKRQQVVRLRRALISTRHPGRVVTFYLQKDLRSATI